MASDSQQDLVPAHRQGARTGASTRLELQTRHDAILLFNEAKRRLLDVNNWHKLVGKPSAVFQITDEKGNPLNIKEPLVGHLIRIDLPAPGNKSGRGYDWVRIERFENDKVFLKDEEVFGFRVRPVSHPDERGDDSAHFYTSDATSTFLIVRNANAVEAMERGRNEKPNTGPRSWINKIRNSVIAVAAMAGMANPQWKGLVNGLLKGPPQE